MENRFYVVKHLINGRSGTLPKEFSSKNDAIMFARMLDAFKDDVDVKTETHLYEVKEIEYLIYI